MHERDTNHLLQGRGLDQLKAFACSLFLSILSSSVFVKRKSPLLSLSLSLPLLLLLRLLLLLPRVETNETPYLLSSSSVDSVFAGRFVWSREIEVVRLSCGRNFARGSRYKLVCFSWKRANQRVVRCILDEVKLRKIILDLSWTIPPFFFNLRIVITWFLENPSKIIMIITVGSAEKFRPTVDSTETQTNDLSLPKRLFFQLNFWNSPTKSPRKHLVVTLWRNFYPT